MGSNNGNQPPQLYRSQLASMVTYLSEPNSRGVLLQAPEGFGKRQLVEECVARIRPQFKRVIQVDSWGIAASLSGCWEFYLERMITFSGLNGPNLESCEQSLREAWGANATLLILGGLEQLADEDQKRLNTFAEQLLSDHGESSSSKLLIMAPPTWSLPSWSSQLHLVTLPPLEESESIALLKYYDAGLLWQTGGLKMQAVHKILAGHPLWLRFFAQIQDLELAHECMFKLRQHQAVSNADAQLGTVIAPKLLQHLRSQGPRAFAFLLRFCLFGSPLGISSIAKINFALDKVEGKPVGDSTNISDEPVPESYLEETRIHLQRLAQLGLIRPLLEERYAMIPIIREVYQFYGEDQQAAFKYFRDVAGAALVRQAWQAAQSQDWTTISQMADELLIIAQRALEENKLKGCSGLMVPLAPAFARIGRRFSAMRILQICHERLRDHEEQSRENKLTHLLVISRLAELLTVGQSWEEAREAYSEALALARECKELTRVATLLYHLAIVHENLGEITKALEACQESLALCQEFGHRQGEAAALHQIALIYANHKKVKAALKRYRQSLEIKQEIGDRTGEAATLVQMGQLNVLSGNPFDGLQQIREGYTIFKELQDPRAAQVAAVLKLAGQKAALRLKVSKYRKP